MYPLPMVMAVRVGVVSWNTANLLDRCLEALPAALEGVRSQVVVVDNASDDGSADVAVRHTGVKVIRNKSNLGYAKGVNQALSYEAGASPPSALIALNPDTVPPPRSLARLVDRLLSDPTVGLVVPRLLNSDESPQHSVYRFPSPTVSGMASFVPIRWQPHVVGPKWWLEGASNFERRCDIDWAIGAVHVLRPEAVNQWTPYRESWFMYAEDLDLCWRMAQLGWRRRLEGDVTVMHIGNAAGSQAWGTGRTERWLEATYDWYRLAHGEPSVRRWAAVNVAGVTFRMAGAGWRRMRGTPQEEWERDLRRALPLHLNVLRGRLSTAENGRSPLGSPRRSRSRERP